MKRLAILLCAIGFAFPLLAQNQNAPSPIIFIYDASGSMWGKMQDKTKVEIASEVLSGSVNTLPEDQKIGLVAYGHRQKGNCKDVEFLVAASNTSKTEINSALKKIKPLGMTPLAYSATLVINSLKEKKTKATIILITDGIESCNGNICEVVKTAKKEGIDFKLHIVGFGLKAGETEQLKCAANAGDGVYYDASDASGLGQVLQEATSATIDKPKGNFGVLAQKNGKPIDAFVKAYKGGTKEEVGTLRTYGETRYLFLPSGTYDLVAFPMGSDVNSVMLKNQESFDDKKTERIISFDGGKVEATTTNNGKGWDTMVKLIDANGKVAASIRTYGALRAMEVNPGTYKVTFLALAMEGIAISHEIEHIEVTAGETIPVNHDFETGEVKIYTKVGNEQVDAIVNFKETSTGKEVAASRTYNHGASFLLNPGNYEVRIKTLGKHNDKKAQTLTLQLQKGETIEKTLNF